MTLKEYRRKRNFARSREPQGESPPAAAGQRYVMQKHAARRLHYDLRLELDGVLKSWAVPKGPSLDPAEKRLAVQVEDHPLAYGAFEGRIPVGQYGGGTVMLWDRGVWEPAGEPAAAYRQGKLTFRLRGDKLRGLWSLTRMQGRGHEDGRKWLLIKHQDQEARPETKYSVLEAQPFSVSSHRSLEEIAQAEELRDEAANGGEQDPTPARLANARRAAQPETIKPQLAVLARQPPADDDWLHEIKLDGYRIMALLRDKQVRLLSRNGKEWTARFPAVAEALAAFPASRAILDGEIVVLRPDGTSDFQALQNLLRGGGTGTLVYYLFDLPYCQGYDLTRTPLLERKRLLKSLLERMEQGVLRFSDHIRSSGSEVFRQACRLSVEGVVSKRHGSGYVQKRSADWLKIKCLRRQEFVIGGFTRPSGARTGFGALLLGYYDGGQLIYTGRVGTGFKAETLNQLTSLLDRLRQEAPPFGNPPTGAEARGVSWVKPALVAEVQFREWTADNILRHTSFLGLREDKEPAEIVREYPVARAPAPQPAVDRPGWPRGGGTRKAAADPLVAGIRLTNPDKVLYPEQGISKRALAAFYEAIAAFILPHIVNRPLTLLRCPAGRQKTCFYQRHPGQSVPEAVRVISAKEKGTTKEYLVVDDLPGLISLVQMGVLEIHPWGCRAPALAQPDLLIFDLDPGPGVAWRQLVEGARLLGERLAALGLPAFVKTSGGKGLHLLVPIAPGRDWQEAKAFAKAVADDLSRRWPGRFIATSSKAKREGKIFVDYLRNDRTATSVAAYSTRARAGAPVSTPIRWEELARNIKPDSYTITNLPRRLAALKKEVWPGFFSSRQPLRLWSAAESGRADGYAKL